MFKKFGQAIRNVYRGQKGITGLETAIILIAFVTVAAVLAYTVLSAGIFSSERGKEAVYSGLNSAGSTMGVKGAVIGESLASVASEAGPKMTFNLALAITGTSVDLTKCVFNYWDSVGNKVNNIELWTSTAATPATNITVATDAVFVSSTTLSGVGDVLVIVHPAWAMGALVAPVASDPDPAIAAGHLAGAFWGNQGLAAYATFTLQIIPPTGATITIQKTLPGSIANVVNLN